MSSPVGQVTALSLSIMIFGADGGCSFRLAGMLLSSVSISKVCCDGSRTEKRNELIKQSFFESTRVLVFLLLAYRGREQAFIFKGKLASERRCKRPELCTKYHYAEA